MFGNLSEEEKQTIEASLEPKLAWAAQRQAECEQMALDATRLLSCTESRIQNYTNQGFFQRCWSDLTGKNGVAQRANQNDLIEMQKYAWRYINLLQERDLLQAHSVIMVKNNLQTLAVEQNDIKSEISELANRVLVRFEELESRVGGLEKNLDLLNWVVTLEARDYDDRFPPNLRMLRIISDFFALNPGPWDITDLNYLRIALKNAKLPAKESISIDQFIGNTLDEIEKCKIDTFNTLISPNSWHNNITDEFIITSVAAPSFSALYEIKDSYVKTRRTLEQVQKNNQLSAPPAEAIKDTFRGFLDERGIDRQSCIPRKDLAIEILGCFRLVEHLSNNKNNRNDAEIIDVKIDVNTKDDVSIDCIKSAFSYFPKNNIAFYIKDDEDMVREYISTLGSYENTYVREKMHSMIKACLCDSDNFGSYKIRFEDIIVFYRSDYAHGDVGFVITEDKFFYRSDNYNSGGGVFSLRNIKHVQDVSGSVRVRVERESASGLNTHMLSFSGHHMPAFSEALRKIWKGRCGA